MLSGNYNLDAKTIFEPVSNPPISCKTLPHKTLSCDVCIVGTGVAGLFCALHINPNKKVILISKTAVDECDSMLAQGGICVLLNDADYDSYYEDTMRAGHYENRPESVDIMLRSSRQVINELIDYGVNFAHDKNGDLAYTREGAHSEPRICYHEDTTGKEITTHLLEAVQRLDNVSIYDQTCMTDLIIESAHGSRYCQGIHAISSCTKLASTSSEKINVDINATSTVLACGGLGGLYEHSTNYPILTGDGIRLCSKHNIELEHIDYVQIHPTTLYSTKPGRSFLISESCRGEGALLYNNQHQRFVNELLPRDVVTQAIFDEMKKTSAKHVWLSFENLSSDIILNHFPAIYHRCLEEGYDILKEPIPVVPAQHYLMGGIHVDSNSATTMPALWAVGETSCNGVHGKNRLASNSLLESLVFAKRAAAHIMTCQKEN